MKCPKCKSELKNVIFDVGYGINVESSHCEKCGFNMTKEKELSKVMNLLKKKIKSYDEVVLELIREKKKIPKSMLGSLKGKAKVFTSKEREEMWRDHDTD